VGVGVLALAVLLLLTGPSPAIRAGAILVPLWALARADLSSTHSGLIAIRTSLGAVTLLVLAIALWRYWEYRFLTAEGRSFLARALALPLNPPTALVRGLAGAAYLAWMEDDMEAAVSACEEGMALDAGEDPAGKGALLNILGEVDRHRPGRAMRAVRDGEVAAAASGVNVAGYKTLAFGVSAFYAGVAGSLFALSTGFVSPDTFPVGLSIQLLVGGVVGGLASIPGPLLGAVFVYYLPIESNQWVPSQSWIPSQIATTVIKAGPAVTYGAVLILIMIFAPNGIVGLVNAGYSSLRRRLRGAGDRETGQMPPDPQTV